MTAEPEIIGLIHSSGVPRFAGFAPFAWLPRLDRVAGVVSPAYDHAPLTAVAASHVVDEVISAMIPGEDDAS